MMPVFVMSPGWTRRNQGHNCYSQSTNPFMEATGPARDMANFWRFLLNSPQRPFEEQSQCCDRSKEPTKTPKEPTKTPEAAGTTLKSAVSENKSASGDSTRSNYWVNIIDLPQGTSFSDIDKVQVKDDQVVLQLLKKMCTYGRYGQISMVCKTKIPANVAQKSVKVFWCGFGKIKIVGLIKSQTCKENKTKVSRQCPCSARDTRDCTSDNCERCPCDRASHGDCPCDADRDCSSCTTAAGDCVCDNEDDDQCDPAQCSPVHHVNICPCDPENEQKDASCIPKEHFQCNPREDSEHQCNPQDQNLCGSRDRSQTDSEDESNCDPKNGCTSYINDKCLDELRDCVIDIKDVPTDNCPCVPKDQCSSDPKDSCFCAGKDEPTSGLKDGCPCDPHNECPCEPTEDCKYDLDNFTDDCPHKCKDDIPSEADECLCAAGSEEIIDEKCCTVKNPDTYPDTEDSDTDKEFEIVEAVNKDAIIDSTDYDDTLLQEAQEENPTSEPDLFETRIDVRVFKVDEIKVKLVGNIIHVDALHDEMDDDDEGNSVHFEMHRSISIPPDVDTEALRSSLSQDGELVITAPNKVTNHSTEKILEIEH